MNTQTPTHLALIILTLVLTSCGTPSDGPQAWLDWPLDNTTVPLAKLTIQAHASDEDGIAQFEFSANDALLFTVDSDGKRLGEAVVEWMPPGPGIYLLAVHAVDGSGNRGALATARVTISGSTTPTPDGLFLSETITPFAESAETTFEKINHVECADGFALNVDISIGNPQGIQSYSVWSTWVDAETTETFTEPYPQNVDKRVKLVEPFFDSVDRDHQIGLEVIRANDPNNPVRIFALEPNNRCPGHYVEKVEIGPSDSTAPLVNATQNANCRNGPSLEYDIVTSLLEGQSAEITGRSADGSWWQLDPGLGDNKACWISGSVVQVSGDVSGVVVVSAPPLPTTETPTPIIPTVTASPTDPPLTTDTAPPSFFSTGVYPEIICPSPDSTTTIAASVADESGLSSVIAYWNIDGAENGQVTLSEGGLGYAATIGPVNNTGTMEVYITAWDTYGNVAQSDNLYVNVISCIE
jgi:uncharacterized protein YraI